MREGPPNTANLVVMFMQMTGVDDPRLSVDLESPVATLIPASIVLVGVGLVGIIVTSRGRRTSVGAGLTRRLG